MGSLSFGISELMANADGEQGWFRLLNEEEGEFYHVPCTDDAILSIQEIENKRQVWWLNWHVAWLGWVRVGRG